MSEERVRQEAAMGICLTDENNSWCCAFTLCLAVYPDFLCILSLNLHSDAPKKVFVIPIYN